MYCSAYPLDHGRTPVTEHVLRVHRVALVQLAPPLERRRIDAHHLFVIGWRSQRYRRITDRTLVSEEHTAWTINTTAGGRYKSARRLPHGQRPATSPAAPRLIPTRLTFFQVRVVAVVAFALHAVVTRVHPRVQPLRLLLLRVVGGARGRAQALERDALAHHSDREKRSRFGSACASVARVKNDAERNNPIVYVIQ